MIAHSRIALVTALVAALVLVPAALAGKSGGSGGSTGTPKSSLSLVLSYDANGDGLPNWGDTVTWNISTTASTSTQVSLTCYQGGTEVYYANASFYAGNPFAYMDYMPLKSGAWTGGAASCSAVLFYSSGKRTITLATSNFSVAA